MVFLGMMPSAALAGPAIAIEAVNNYSACNGPSLSNPISDATGFQSTMTIPGSNPVGFSAGPTYFDNLVWTSDFYDPQITTDYDYDQLYFDKRGNAISYFAGHGVCDVGDTSQFCTSSSTCNSPPAGTQMPGFCRRWPGYYTGTCSYIRMARQIAVGNCAAGPQPRGGRVNYSSVYVKWGESVHSGNFTGAGTNGGTNVVVLASSCAEMSGRGQEVWPAFAGMHLLANVLVHQGDTASVDDRGPCFAFSYLINPSGSVATAWMDAVNCMPGTPAGGSDCLTYGGGHGINGCGGHVVTALDSNPLSAVGHLYEDWYAVRLDSNDATGNGYWASDYMCNYDCWTWPFAL